MDCLTVGKWKDKIIRSLYYEEKAKAKFLINTIRHKYYHWAMFKHAMEFLKQRTSIKKPLLKYYFASFLKNLSNENLVALFELLATTIGKPKRRL